MTPESRIVLWSCGAAVVIAVVALCIHAAQYVPAWAWWAPAGVVALALAVAYRWAVKKRRQAVRWALQKPYVVRLPGMTIYNCPCSFCEECRAEAARIRALPWYRVALWGTGKEEGER